MLTMKKTKLKALRLELKPPVTQEDFSIAATLRLKTYRRAENGENTSYTTAMAILQTLNMYRSNRSMELVTLDDLELNIV